MKVNDLPEGATFDQICDAIKKTHTDKQGTYSSEPVAELPLDVWLAQTQIKATRAKYAVDLDKRIDELIDTAVYAILSLEKIANEPEE
jgi:hypothetical protein